MPGLLDSLRQELSGNAVQQLSANIGADHQMTQSAVAAAVPAMLGAMAQTAQQPGGETVLAQAAEQHAGLLGNIGSLLGGRGPADVPATGGGLLSRVLGDRQEQVQSQVAQTSGLAPDQTKRLLMALAPVALAVLARHRSQGQIQPGGLAGALLQGQNAAQQAGPGGLLGLVERKL